MFLRIGLLINFLNQARRKNIKRCGGITTLITKNTSKMIWPDNDDWIHDLIAEAKEKKEKLLTELTTV